jgi:N-acyl homoserine lactone hydrolase
MKLYAMSCGRLRCHKNIFVPDIPADLLIESPMPAFLITHPEGNVLVDTGPHPDVFKNAVSRWGGLAKAIHPIGDERSGIIAQLNKIGFSPHNIKYVVNSHLHPDHAGGNEFFENSIFLIQKKELECARNPKYEGKGYVRGDWDHPLNYIQIDGNYDIFGDGSLTVMPMPGHTLGHQILLVRLVKKGSVILSGDCVPCEENFMQSKVARINMDDNLALLSIKRLHELVQKENAFVIYNHDPNQWRKIKKPPKYYD